MATLSSEPISTTPAWGDSASIAHRLHEDVVQRCAAGSEPSVARKQVVCTLCRLLLQFPEPDEDRFVCLTSRCLMLVDQLLIKGPVFAKLFDNEQALPFHVHHRDVHAAPLGKVSKPEAYYYPPQLNNHLGAHPVSFLGLQPQVTREQLRERLTRFGDGGDNRVTELSLGYRTRLGTGWDIPAGVLHAPASACTYEPQAASDVLCMCESWSNNREVPDELLWKDVPADRVGDLEYVLDLLDWELNIDPDFVQHRRLIPFETDESDPAAGWVEKWIVHKSQMFSAKELTIMPGATASITDTGAYGAIVVQGRGTFGVHSAATPTLIRFGDLAEDEFFVSEEAARRGVPVANHSTTEPLVLLKHFGPGSRCLPHLPSAPSTAV